jgi:hypothetical protein
MPRRRKAKALLDVQAAGSGLSVNTVQREVQVKGGIRDLESHCARLQALCNQVQASLEYVTAENEQLRLALAPAEIEPEPIRISVQVTKACARSRFNMICLLAAPAAAQTLSLGTHTATRVHTARTH